MNCGIRFCNVLVRRALNCKMKTFNGILNSLEFSKYFLNSVLCCERN